jgi:hypothetical protein
MTNKRMDANEVAFLELQLEYMRQQEIEIEYAVPKALSFVPVFSNLPPGASSFAYYEMDRRGTADWLANGSSDVPFVSISGAKHSSPLHTFGDAYQYSDEDIEAAMMANLSLDQKLRREALMAMAEKMDSIIAVGEPTLGFSGLLNHPSVQHKDAAAPASGSDKSWQGVDKTNKEILADMNNLVNEIPNQTKDRHFANLLLLPSTLYRFVQDTVYDTGGTNGDSILTVFKRNHPEVRVEMWHLLELADTAGTGPRAVAMEMDPNNCEFVIAKPVSEKAPHRQLRSWVVSFEARTGGIVLYRPLTMVYQDDI